MTNQPPTQKEFWNGPVGEQWVKRQEALDTMLLPMTAPTIAALGAHQGQSVLDVGCGTGTTTFMLARDGARPLGADISAPMIAYAKQRAAQMKSGAEFIVADATLDAFPGAPFDALFSRFGVMFFEQPEIAFKNLHAQIKPGGKMAFVCWRGAAENPWQTIPVNAVVAMLPRAPPPMDPNAPGPMAFANPDRVRGILEGAGWKGVELQPWDGELTLGKTVDESSEFMAGMFASRIINEFGLDAADARRRVADALKPLAQADGAPRTAGACWIVTARR